MLQRPLFLHHLRPPLPSVLLSQWSSSSDPQRRVISLFNQGLRGSGIGPSSTSGLLHFPCPIWQSTKVSNRRRRSPTVPSSDPWTSLLNIVDLWFFTCTVPLLMELPFYSAENIEICMSIALDITESCWHNLF
jgi:hypothetical protein